MSADPFSKMPKLGVPNTEQDLNRVSDFNRNSNASGYGEQSSPFGGGRSLLRAPSAQDFDAMKTEVEDFVFKLKSVEIKCEQFETVNKRMALVELNSQKVGSACNGAIEEFRIHVETFKDRINQQELETENSKRTSSLLMDNFEAFQE